MFIISILVYNTIDCVDELAFS
ncbi:hypothetical protein [Oleomonas cavernae]